MNGALRLPDRQRESDGGLRLKAQNFCRQHRSVEGSGVRKKVIHSSASNVPLRTF
jgi:hypothetical protein